MSSSATDKKASDAPEREEPAQQKGKSKALEEVQDKSMDGGKDDGDDDDDDDEEEEEEEGEEEEDMEEDNFEEIDPTAIRSKRTRGVRVDYTSPEALEKAGLKPEEEEEDDEMEH